MNFAFANSNRHSWDALRRALHTVPPTLLEGMMACAVLCALVPVMAGTFHTAAWLAVPPPVAVHQAAADLGSPAQHRCPGCGTVEGIRLLAPGDAATAPYEFTVRMRDGSLRTSTTSGKASWRVGDRILLLGGPAAQ